MSSSKRDYRPEVRDHGIQHRFDPGSVQEQMAAIYRLLDTATLPAPGFDANCDGEIWEWVCPDDMMDLHEKLAEAEYVLNQLRRDLVGRMYAHCTG